MPFDPYLSILKSIEDKLDNLTNDVSEIKEAHSEDISLIKVEQAKCNSRWDIFNKITTFGLGSLSLGSLWAWITNQK